jgi:uncharacterized protein
MAEERRQIEEKPALSVADPAPLGLGAFALTTFILSAHNAFGAPAVPLLGFFGYALFYGGLAQFMAGMWEFRNRNSFGATAFSTYGAFWMGLAAFIALVLFGKVTAKEVMPSLGLILLAFFIFNTYMMVLATRVNLAVFAVFATLEVTELLLWIGNFAGQAAGTGLVAVGGFVGIITALVAWYASAATLANSMGPRPVLPVGPQLWDRLPMAAQLERPLPRARS